MLGKKIMNVFGLLMVVMALFSASVLAVDPANDIIKYIEINDNKVEDGDRLEVRLGETLDIVVKVEGPAEGVLIETALVYEYGQYDNSVRDQTRTFNVDAETVAYKELSVQIPIRMAKMDDALLHVFVYSANREAFIYTFPLNIEGVEREEAVLITEAYLSPSTVMAGRGTKATVKVKNYGDKALDDVTLLVRVPGLNLQDVETLDEIEENEKETFENLVLRIPCDAKPGVYEVVYTLKFDEYESTTMTSSLTVIPAEDCGATSTQEETGKTVITVPDNQMLTVGNAGVAYPVVITNMGNNAKSYQLTVQGVESWGTARIDPSSTVIVNAGQTATAFVYVSANENAQAGEKIFQLTINDGVEQKQIPLKATISADSSNDWSGLKKVLEVGLIILVIILIVIGLIVGFNKLRGNDEEDDDEKTYY